MVVLVFDSWAATSCSSVTRRFSDLLDGTALLHLLKIIISDFRQDAAPHAALPKLDRESQKLVAYAIRQQTTVK